MSDSTPLTSNQPIPPNPGQVILINKPLRWTSFDVVKKLKFAIKAKKIGHAGTLDPLATGLLILCTEKMTKQIDTYQAQEKEYTGKLVLGKTTPSIDLETEFDAEYPTDHITVEKIHEAAQKLTGEIQQIPPIFSAIRIDGKRAYHKARKGKTEADLEIKPRTVLISAFEITEIQLPEVSFRIVCSKGTYIRSMVRDFGQLLDSGAYMSELCRTRIGEFRLENAQSIEDFINLHKKDV
ncbi:tRNA pseudouridine(55) synthase TruB [Xanthocytophaga agilis]|uniref:tRNA pseudouridine synthase B n=1 Tax=Xanthocytophaga agilis TaxID=3048010 RepID=A0AAE3UI53_9BACT|nr:tRNA pseudouridine(55) synthase TruB [Xanthocytophaga agilis]MDJ1504976.1 tRNA pseudouridine(55) synthase TruB [Xanthocytophaga agilis]